MMHSDRGRRTDLLRDEASRYRAAPYGQPINVDADEPHSRDRRPTYTVFWQFQHRPLPRPPQILPPVPPINTPPAYSTYLPSSLVTATGSLEPPYDEMYALIRQSQASHANHMEQQQQTLQLLQGLNHVLEDAIHDRHIEVHNIQTRIDSLQSYLTRLGEAR